MADTKTPAQSFEDGFRDATGKKKRKPDGSEDDTPSTAAQMLSDAGAAISDAASSAAEMLGFGKKKK